MVIRLIRKVIEVAGVNPKEAQLAGKSLAEHVMAPTKIYVKPVLQLTKHADVHAICHLTGGGFWENIPRVLPKSVKKRSLMSKVGNGSRFSTGYKNKAILNMTKCTVLSTVVSA